MAETPPFVFVPVVVHRRQKEIDPATGKVSGSPRIVKFLDWLYVKNKTAAFLNIEPSFAGAGDTFNQFAKAVAGSKAASGYGVTSVDDYLRNYFSGIDDASGTQTAVWGREIISRMSSEDKKRKSISIRTSVKTKSASGKSDTVRTISLSFPAYFSRLMIAQCASSLCAAKPDKVASYFTIDNVKYPLYPYLHDGTLSGASTGAYLAKSIPSGLTEPKGNVPNDSGTPAAVQAADLAT